jgi:valyl-tRNA synthetase
LRQDEDVLDTWFSSALWPFAALGWPERTPGLRAFYPTAALSTARDILFLWVARMIMMGIEFTGTVPFSDVYIHSVIQAPDGRRMSKSLGTGIDPLTEIDAHGADAVRFGLLAMSSTQDVRYSAEKVKQGQALANKLFNAARFVLGRIGELGLGDMVAQCPAPEPRTVEDRWILSRLERITADTATRIRAYDFSHAALGLYDFVYGELCDWYLELVKHRLSAESADVEDHRALAATLLALLRDTVAFCHPVIPFVTEELWPHLGGQGLLAGASYPQEDRSLIDPDAERQVGGAIEAITLVRGWRGSVGARPGLSIPARLNAEGYEPSMQAAIERLARLDLSRAVGEPVAQIAVPGGSVEILSGEGLDLAGAKARSAKAREKLEQEIARAKAKLSNQGFREQAPPAVVAGEEAKLERLQSELGAL